LPKEQIESTKMKSIKRTLTALVAGAVLTLPGALDISSATAQTVVATGPQSLVPKDDNGLTLVRRHGHWRGHHHHHHGSRFFVAPFFFGPYYYNYGYYGSGRNSCYWNCRHYHGPRYCRWHWRRYC
jgi:hypothetical protein